ncbi:hypothetical protein I6E17_03535 [Fusobacterium perfoetens]|uniref:hypothetical protein n=1 Tax=Fusobacterium perfoetens TaxID=852 RepID=UPI001F2D65C3|nr:hypothetical protein [Fusobacterium perfoetens]MCF2625252.1 hypothetical protein [Fusobacterium perfoetens]
MLEKNQSMEYNPLEKLEQSLYNKPLKKENSAFGYYADNIPEGSWDVMNAHSNQIMNKTATTLYRMADSLFGWAMNENAREEMLLDMEQLREDYIDTENKINQYLYNYAGNIEAVALNVGGMLYRGFADPVNQAINYATFGASGMSGFFVNFVGDAMQYTADTSFYENRNPLADLKLQDLANVGMNAAMSYGTMKMQQRYAGMGNDFLYNESGNFKDVEFYDGKPRLEDKYLIDVNNPDEFMPKKNKAPEIAPLEKALKVNEENPELSKIMKDRGYWGLVDMKAMSQVAIRQEYGQPQASYKDYGIKQDVHNFVKSVTGMNKKYQQEVYQDGKVRNSSISTEMEITHALKPLETGFENALDFYYGEYARQLSDITGFNSSTGDMIYEISQGLPKNVLADGLYGKNTFSPDGKDFKLMSFLKQEFDDYRKGLNLEDDYDKAVLYEKIYAKNEHQAKVRKAYENMNFEEIKKMANYIGNEVELTEAEAQAAGLRFVKDEFHRTIEKGQGSYRDFEPEVKKLKSKVKNYVKKEKETNAASIKKETDELKEIYKQKAENIKKGKESIQTEKRVLKDEIKGIRQNRDLTLEEQHKNIISEKEKINTSYREQITGIKTERDSKIKEVKNKISEIRKAETAELNKIQKNVKLYDLDKLPLARKIQRKNAKAIRKLKDEISGIEKEYNGKISELEKKQKTEFDSLTKQELDLKNSLKKGIDKYGKASEKHKNKFIRRTKADIERELKKLQSEYDGKEAAIIKKYKGKEYNKYAGMQKRLGKINEKNYKKFYKNFKTYEKDFKEIKNLKDLVDNRGRYVYTNTYSIHDNPIEVAHAFYNDLVRTNVEARKQINIGAGDVNLENPNIKKAADYRNIYYMAEKWGNKTVVETMKDGKIEAHRVDPVDNFIKSAYGNERETYEIITNILSENAEQKAGANEIYQLLANLTVNNGKYSREFSVGEQFGMTGLTHENRKYAIDAINNMLEKNIASRRIAPNMWYDNKANSINSNMSRRAFKGLMSIKFLGNLNYLREIPQNNLRVVAGARRLGWNKKYNIMKDFTDGIKVTYQLAKNYDNLKNNTLDGITDPIIRRRAELFIDKKLANSIVYNEVEGINNNLLRWGQKAIDSSSSKIAVGQPISDIQRISSAEFAAINYMLDILPTAKSPLLSKILTNNGIDDVNFGILNNRIKELGSEGLMELVWSGKRPTNSVDYRIKSLFEQFSDVMGKEFNAYQKHNTFKETGSFLSDTLYMFKRYSLGAIDGFTNNLMTYIDDDGMIRKSFYNTGDFKINYKNMLRGVNMNCKLPFLYSSITSALIYSVGIKYAQGKVFGGIDDERAEAKFESLASIDGLLSFATTAVIDNMLNVTGAGIVFGGSSVLGSAYEMALARAKRAYTADDLESGEALGDWALCLFLPEPAARGIDYIKFQKNIPNRITTFSETEQDIWKYDKKIDAELEQLEGKLPYDIDWLSFWKKRPEEARMITGSPDSMPDEIVVVGATGLSKLMEETAETAAIAEQMTEPKEVREKNLKAMGLDIDSLLTRMELADVRNFNAAVSFMKIRDEEELLMCAYNYFKSKDKQGFINSMMTDDEKMFFNAYKDNISKNRKKINKSVKREKGIDNYIESLNIIDSYATGQMN